MSLVRSSFVHRTQSWTSIDIPGFCYFFCLASVFANLKFSEFLRIKVSECYFHVKVVYGITEDCFEIESRKSPSLFIISSSTSRSSSIRLKLTLHGL